MIPVREIITAVRFQVGDMQSVVRSDFEIVEAINRAQAFIYAAFGERHISVSLKTVFIELNNDEPWVMLPSDFHNVNKIKSGYAAVPESGYAARIEGNKFVGEPGVYELSYYCLPRRVTDASDTLNIPNSVRLGLEGVAAAFVNGDPAGAEAATKRLCDVLVAREVDGFKNTGPVQVWGDRA